MTPKAARTFRIAAMRTCVRENHVRIWVNVAPETMESTSVNVLKDTQVRITRLIIEAEIKGLFPDFSIIFLYHQ